MPKVETKGIENKHIYSLISSLAKKGLLFADCKPENVGLIKVNGEEIPVVIGDGAVCPIHSENEYMNQDLFLNRIRKFRISDKNTEYFLTNQDYIHYPWGDKNGKWAQDEFLEQQGLAEVRETGKPKGIISKEVLKGLEERRNDQYLQPIAKELLGLIIDHSLREQDVKHLAADKIAEIIHSRGGDKQSFLDFVSKNSKNPTTQHSL